MSSERTERVWTVLDLLRWTTDHFASRGIDTPRLDAEVLLAYALECDRLRLYVEYEKPVEEPERARFRALVQRRADERIPVALLTGTREFWSLSFEVTPDVLVPRPETETLVTAALERLPDAEAELRVLDVGTGSGAVALALATERPKARVVATDLSAAALAVAGRNAERLGLADRVAFAEGDLFEPLAGERFDLVISNPPTSAAARPTAWRRSSATSRSWRSTPGPTGWRCCGAWWPRRPTTWKRAAYWPWRSIRGRPRRCCSCAPMRACATCGCTATWPGASARSAHSPEGKRRWTASSYAAGRASRASCTRRAPRTPPWR